MTALDRLRMAAANPHGADPARLQQLADALTVEQVQQAWDEDLLTVDQALEALGDRADFPCPDDEHVDVDTDGFCRGCGLTVGIPA